MQKSLLVFVILLMGLQACTLPVTETPTPAPDIGEPPVLMDLFVAIGGDDANDCLSATSACATVWGALRKMTSPAVVHIGAGEFFTTGVSFQPGYDVTFRGAGRDATTLMSDRTTAIIRITLPLRVSIESLTIGRAQEGATDTWGLEIRPAGAVVTMQDCRVADLIHGITISEGASLIIEDCVIERNRDGIYNRGNLTVTDVLFTTNSSALSNGGVANVTNTNVQRNGVFSTSSGAGTAAVSNNGQLTFNSVDIVDNAVYGLIVDGGTVAYNGGQISNNGNMGIWQIQGDFTGQSLIIADNGGYGVNVGGRSSTVPDAGVFRLSQSAILRNYSAGIRIDSGEAHLQNDTISGNTATSSGGGGIWAYGGDIFLLDSTVVYNSGHGIHGSGDGGVITVRRSVIALNSDTECNVDSRISTTYGTPGTYTCNDSMTAAVLKLGGLSEIGGTWVHALQDGSPLIDAGGPVSTCPSVDQRGVSRPIGATCDIGAYEKSFALTAATPDLVMIYTSTPEPISAIFIVNAFCRKGPGTRYFDVKSFKPGDQAQVDGRNDSDPRWLWVLLPSSSDHCWVSGITFETDADLDLLPIQPAPPVPDAPAYLDDSPTCNPNDKTRNVKLNWPGVPGATGFRIYRDSTLIATVGSNIAIYVDTVAYDKSISYGVEAINKDGASERLTTVSGGC